MRNLSYMLLSVVLSIMIHSCKTQAQINNKPLNVGDIAFDPALDKSDFYLCNPEYIYQYYNFTTHYKGEKSALRNEIFSLFKLDQKFPMTNGIITIKFVVNCKGEQDRYRVFQIDRNYKNTEFDPQLIEHLISITKTCNQWQPGLKDDQAVDSYVHISFIFRHGKLIDIAP
jgi:hypothetical protein